jgi:hypothetical protein
MYIVYSVTALLTDTPDGAAVLPQFETVSVKVKSERGEADLCTPSHIGCIRGIVPFILNPSTG